MDGALPIGNSLRLAIIDDVEETLVWCKYLGRLGEHAFDCPIPYPYASNGAGIITGIEKGSVVLVAEAAAEQRYIIAFVPVKDQYFDQEGIDDVVYNNTPFPKVDAGELMFKSSGGSYINIHPDGEILLDTSAGDGAADFELSRDTRSLFIRTDNKYSFTEAGRSIEGIIRRDKSVRESELNTFVSDFLSGAEYDNVLETIGRVPQYEVQIDTTEATRNFVRNPALTEKRSIIYEYANSFGLGKFTDEVELMKGEHVAEKLGSRSKRRTDVLNLNILNYNHLIEKVEGTLVDIYGNILDINRNIIAVPDYETLGLSEDRDAAVKAMYDYMRRSVKYHFEINSRKEIPKKVDEPSRGKNTINQREHSRWSIDVDGEGLTKLNIPSSSDTGNIPVLGRYITSRDEKDKESGNFRDESEKDIRISAFSINGPTISNSAYVPETMDESTVTVGTAYHDLMAVADSIFQSGKFNTPSDRMSTSVNNKIGSLDANAGGRSLHANLDGSAEISIGADSVDSKSLLLDLEGGIVSHYGADNNGRSIIHQSDGTVLIQVGSADGNSGRIEIHLVNGKKSQKIIIDENGLTIDVSGNMILNAGGSIGINAGANLLLHGAHVSIHGSVDASPKGARTVNVGSTTMLPTGMPQGGPFG